MVKIFKAPSGPDPIAGKMRELGQALFGNQVGNALENEKLYAAQRANAETDNLMRRIAENKGVQALGSDPIAQAILLGSGYDPGDFSKIGRMGAATEFGAADPRTANWQVGSGDPYSSTAPAFDATLAEKRRENDMTSADRRYGVDQSQATERFKWGNLSADQAADNAEATRNNDMTSADRRYGVDQNIGQQRYEFDRKPVAVMGPDGQPVYAPQADAPGARPVLSETDQKGTLLGQNWGNLPALNPMQRQVLGANPTEKTQTPRNYVLGTQSFITYDGVTDAQSGQPLPPGGYIGNVEGGAGDVGLTNSTLSGVQQNEIAAQRFISTLNLAEPLTQDPTLFGPQGFIRSKAQDILQSMGGVAQVVGGTQAELANNLVSAETGQLLGPEAAKALIPELYDPRLSEVEALWGILLYQGAAALAGQENRSVSDMDVQMMRAILGDPHSLFASNLSMKSKLDVARKLIAESRRVNRQYLGGQPTPDAAPQAPAPSQGGASVDDLVNKYRSR